MYKLCEIIKTRQNAYYKYIVFIIKEYEGGEQELLKRFINHVYTLHNKVGVIFEDTRDFDILVSGFKSQNINKLLYLKYKYLVHLENESK